MTDQPLFDFDHEPAPRAPKVPDDPQSQWHEVPQAIFLSWPEIQQLKYCARRDEDALAHTGDQDEMTMYRERIAWYRAEIARLSP